MSFTHGAIWWSELMTRDVEAAVAFYRDVCGWSIEKMDMPEGPYWIAIAHGKPVAGFMDMSGRADLGEMPPRWFTYIAVDDVDAAVEASEAAGGRIERPGFNVPGVGRIAIVCDASGAVVGLMTPEVPMETAVVGDEVDVDNVPV